MCDTFASMCDSVSVPITVTIEYSCSYDCKLYLFYLERGLQLSSRHTVRRSFTGYIEVYFSLRRSMTVLLRNRNEAYKCFWICCHWLDEVYEIPVLCLFCCVCITMSLCRSFVIEWLVYSHTTFISSGRYRIIICEYEQKQRTKVVGVIGVVVFSTLSSNVKLFDFIGLGLRSHPQSIAKSYYPIAAEISVFPGHWATTSYLPLWSN